MNNGALHLNRSQAAVRGNGQWRSGTALFARNFFINPKMLGSIVPSSRFLVRRLLNQINWDQASVIIEYGPGIGNISVEILKRLRPDGTLIVIDTNQQFVRFLKRSIPDPRLRVVHGSAEEVDHVLHKAGLPNADHVVAGIPFSIIPAEVRETILRRTLSVLRPSGSLLVYQFSLAVRPYLERVFPKVVRQFEWLNVLPAHVFCCQARNGNGSSK